MRFTLHHAFRRLVGLAAAGLLAVPRLVPAVVLDDPDNDPPEDPPKECESTTATSCDCESGEDAVENGCVLVTLDLGRTTPWTGAAPVRLKIYTRESGPSLSTPEQLKLVLGYTLTRLGSDRTSAGAPATVEFAEPTGRTVRFRFAEGSSVGVPLLALPADGNVRLQMVDAEGWATLSAPAFYDLYPGDGSVWRYAAAPAAPDFGALVHRIDPRGVVRTWEDMGVTVLRDAAGRLRQVATRTRLADIVADSDAHYAVTVYPLVGDPDTDPDTGLLVPPSVSPVRVLDVRRGASEQELLVGLRKGTGDLRAYRYEAKNGDWELTRPSGLVDARELYYNADETGAVRLHLVRDASGALLRRTERNYADRPWGWALTNKIEGLDGELRRVTSWSYVVDGPNRGKVAEKITPTGNRILYEYDAQNRVVRESMPLVEEETLYSYAPVDPSDPPLLCDTRPRCVVRKMQGVEIRRTYYVYGTNGVDVVERVGEQGAAYGGTNVLRTVTTYYPVTGAVTDGLVQSVRHEDGTIDNYAYDLTDGVWTEFVTHVHEQAPDIVPMRTTRSVRVYNALGQLVDSRTDLCTIGVEDLVPQADWTPIARLQYAYDIDGNEIRREDLAGRLWTAEWAGNCCGKVSETDWQGITTTYAYDEEGRIIAKQTGSVLTETAYDALGRVTNVARRGIATTDRPAASVHPSSFAYDSLGRETMSEGEDGIRRLFSYAYRPEGGEVRTITEAPGTDCERVTATVTDPAGRTIRELRNGALRRTTVYAPLRETVYEGSKGTNSPVWHEMRFDRFDRLAETHKPGFSGAVLHSSNAFDEFGNTVEIEDGCTSTAPGSAPVVTSRRLSAFDEFGALVLSAEDVNRNGRIDFDGPDVVVSNAVGFSVRDGSLWRESARHAFPDTNSAEPLRVSTSRVRLTGLGAAEATELGEAILVADTQTVDAFGNTASQRSFVDRSSRRFAIFNDSAFSALSAWNLSIGGLSVSNRTETGIFSSRGYDALGRMIAQTDGRGNATTLVYDAAGRLVSTTDAAGATTAYGYDALGRQVSVTDALGNEKTTTFDADDNAVSLRGAQYPVDYTYDEYGRMAAMSTYRTEDLAHGDVTTWLRDEATGLVTNKVYADGNGPTYAYTPDGKPTRTTWARGAWFENVYDEQGRVVQVLHDDMTLDAAMEYDRLGRPVSSSVSAASYRYALDLLGHVTNEVAVIGGVTNTILRDYDTLGRPTRLRIADSDYDQSFAYDSLGRLSIVGIPGSTVTYAYTPDSLDAGYSVLTTSNAVLTRALTRDPLRRGLITVVSNYVTRSDHALPSSERGVAQSAGGSTPCGESVEPPSFAYAYDVLGRPVTRNADAFGYDALGQVVSARFGEGADPDRYDYDLIGNFVSNRLRGAWTQFDANELNEYATLSTPSTSSTPSTTALAYDPDGNLLTNGVWSYAYDSMNRLSAAASNGVAVAEYAYDAFWRRVGRRAGGAEHRTLYDDWNPIRESVSTGAGTAACDYHWGKDLSGTFQGAGGVGGLLAVRRADGLFLPFYDNLGNVVAYADAEGSVVAAYAYDAFGRTASASGPLAATFEHGFSTKPLDPETGLHYYGYRFYDSGMGRWMNRDPLEEAVGWNVFVFLRNNTLRSIDELGLAELSLRYETDSTMPGKWIHLPKGTKIVKSMDELIADMQSQILASDDNECSCVKRLFIGGHGSAGEIELFRGGSKILIQGGTLRLAASLYYEYPNGQYGGDANPKDNQEWLDIYVFLKQIARYLCPEPYLEFVTCSSGSGSQGETLKEQLQEIFPRADIKLYTTDIAYYFGSVVPVSKKK